MNLNLNIIGRNRDRYKQGKHNAPKKILLFHRPFHRPSKPLENIYEERQSTDCSSGKKKNRRYSSSFVGNVTNHLTIDKEFKDIVGNNSKVKTISSVHEDEDITLCWIETTTIKENKTVRPPKRLVIREYTISFENSVTIPDKYLECKKFEGELTTNDNEIGKTALFEVIDENTKVSKVVNFTSISHVGDIIIWQHKKVKCGVGPVVSKNIIEWNDGSKNPRKRVEIKVSPKLYQLKATSTEESCTESSTEDGKSSRPTDVTTESCDNSTCEVTTISNDILVKSSTKISVSEEKSTKTKETGGENLNLSTGITKSPMLPSAEIFTTTVFPDLSTKKDILNCRENSSNPLCKQENIIQSSSSKEAFTVSAETEESTQISTVEKEPSTSSSKSGEKELSVTTSENINFSTLKMNITTRRGVTEKKEGAYSTSEKDKKTTSIELSSEKLNKTDHVPSSSTITSNEITAKQEVTTTVLPYGVTEFVKESEKISNVFNKLTESSISTESVTTESLTEQTILSSTTSNAIIGYSCGNSKDCASVSSPESCESKNCGSKIIESCKSGACSTEETEEPNTLPPSIKNQSFATDSQSSDKSTTIEIQYTTIATTSQEVENLTATTNVPLITRSTTASKHIFSLKVKVLLEHIEKDKKHNLVEVEKNLSFDENSAQNDHLDLLERLKSLNESVNRETLSALLNCTSLGNLIEKPNVISTQLNETINNSHKELEFTSPSVIEDLISDQSTSEYFENDDFQYPEDSNILDQENDQEYEVPSRKRKRRSLDDKIGDLGGFDIVKKNLVDPEESLIAANPCNASEYLHLTKETIHPSITTNNPEEETSNAAYVETKTYIKNITKEENSSVAFLIKDTDNDTNLITLEYQNVNVTQESIQASTTTNNPEEETSTIRTGSETDTTKEILLNTVPSIKENIGNETKIKVVQQTLPGIQEDVSIGLQHVVSELAQNNLTFVNNIKKIQVQTNNLSTVADGKDDRIHSRIRRAATEEVGHWSNERIREAPMGGNLRSFTEIILYKVFS